MSSSMNRRRFQELSAAAIGGLVAGTMAGCGNSQGESEPEVKTTPVAHLHTCRGLNDCKGQGASGKNECRGQGDCATVEHHSCGGENTCKGLGGCGPQAGLNECKGQGGCKVPLMPDAWETIRERKKAEWKQASNDFGDPPPKPETPMAE